MSAESGTKLDTKAWASLWGRVAPYTTLQVRGKTERRMVVVQWLVMPLVLAGSMFPAPRPHEPATHAFGAAIVMLLHPVFYALLGGLSRTRTSWRDGLLTATDLIVATLVYYLTAARPGYAQVLLYCVVALAATRYPLYRALGIASLVVLLLTFAALLPLHVSPPTLASEVLALFALTYLVGLLSETEKAVSFAAVENARLAQTVLKRNKELSALNTLARTLNGATTLDELISVGLAGMAEALELTSARAYLLDGASLRLAASVGSRSEGQGALDERRRHEAARAVSTHEIVTKGWRASGDAAQLAPGPLCVSVPLIVQETVRGVVQADIPAGISATTETTLETLEIFCSELSVALENVLLRGEAHRTAILQEKNRIAQELHDTVLQMLFGIGLRLQWTLEQLPEDSPLCPALAEARHLSARAGSELRGAIYTLSSDIAEVGLVAAIQHLVDEQAERAGWSANVTVSGTVPELPVLVQNAAHRVVREALMNAYKHAQARDVMVSLRFGPDKLTVVVQDNGVGISDEALGAYRRLPDHFGLRTLADQVEGLGGTLSIYNNDDEPGTTVRAVIPFTGSQQCEACA